MRRLCWILFTAATATTVAGRASAVQDTPDPQPRSTMTGVYTADQAKAGEDVYAGICTGCHTVSEHTGVNFWKSWLGLPASELFIYLRDYMPDDAPGSLSPEEYIRVIAYLFEMNRMPPGETELPLDETALEMITIDSASVADGGGRPAPRR